MFEKSQKQLYYQKKAVRGRAGGRKPWAVRGEGERWTTVRSRGEQKGCVDSIEKR
jgi:hypothetical protein